VAVMHFNTEQSCLWAGLGWVGSVIWLVGLGLGRWNGPTANCDTELL